MFRNLHDSVSEVVKRENSALQEYNERWQREAEQQELAMINLRIEVDQLSTVVQSEARDNEHLHGIL